MFFAILLSWRVAGKAVNKPPPCTGSPVLALSAFRLTSVSSSVSRGGPSPKRSPFQTPPPAAEPPGAVTVPVLPLTLVSSREREVLELVAEGRSNRAISEKLFIADRTVESHVQHVFDKLGLAEDPGTNRRVLAALTILRS